MRNTIDENGGLKVRDVWHIVRAHHRWITVAVGLTLTGSAMGLAQPLLIKQVIDDAATRIAWTSIFVLIALFAGQALVHAIARYVLARTGESIVLRIRLRLVRHLLQLHMPLHDQYRIGDLISRTSADSMALRHIVAKGFANAVTGGISLAATVALMVWLDPVLSLIVVVLIAAGVLIIACGQRGIRAASLRSQQSTGEMTSDLERALGAIRTIRICQAEQRETERIGDRARSIYTANMRMAKLDSVVGPASKLAVNGSFLVALLIGGVRVASGSGSVAELVAFLLYLAYLADPINAVFEAVSTMQQGTGALQRINEVLALPRESNVAPASSGIAPPSSVMSNRECGAPETQADGNGSTLLEFRDVWFAYDTQRSALHGVSFQLPRRGHVALIGRSGAGKSTIFALTERFYDPDRGQILFCGTDVRAINCTDLRARIGLVEQQAPVLHGTLRDNVTYAAPDADEGEIHRVIELANLTDLISRLPRGLDTDVGEHGTALSGGERQRVAIARSLLTRPNLLLLDEPTAHLDADNEAVLSRAINQISAECALLVIAHRYSTVRAADQIIVLDHGEVIAIGAHQHLLNTSSYYQNLAAGWLDSTLVDDKPINNRPLGPVSTTGSSAKPV